MDSGLLQWTSIENANVGDHSFCIIFDKQYSEPYRTNSGAEDKKSSYSLIGVSGN